MIENLLAALAKSETMIKTKEVAEAGILENNNPILNSLNEIRNLPLETIEAQNYDFFENKLNNDINNALTKMEEYKDFKREDVTITRTEDSAHLVWNNFKETAIEIKGDKIYANAGSLNENGKLNQFLNHFIPNKTYIVDKGVFEYKTDSFGRVESSKAELTAAKEIGRNETRDSTTQTLVSSKGIDGKDDGGHIVANQFKGPNEAINQVPMNEFVNRNGEFKNLESEIKSILENPENTEVIHESKIHYENNETHRPSGITINISVNGEKVIERYIKNG